MADAGAAARIVTRDGMRFNVDLPRGTYLPAGDGELALDRQIAELTEAAGAAWARGRQLVEDYIKVLLVERLGEEGPGDVQHSVMAKAMVHIYMATDGECDLNKHEYFQEYRDLEVQVRALRERSALFLAARVGPPEFDCMRQLVDFDRPEVHTEAFRSWFGQSKVVDADGRPLIAFHGTNVDITSFRTSFEQERTRRNPNWAGQLGTWFAAPGDWRGYEAGSAESTAEVFAEKVLGDFSEGAVIYPVYLSIQNPAVFQDHEELHDEIQLAGGVMQLRKHLEAKGHDGLVLDESDTDGGNCRMDVVIFRPSQAKSALGNRGAFCKNDPDMCDRSDPHAKAALDWLACQVNKVAPHV